MIGQAAIYGLSGRFRGIGLIPIYFLVSCYCFLSPFSFWCPFLRIRRFSSAFERQTNLPKSWVSAYLECGFCGACSQDAFIAAAKQWWAARVGSRLRHTSHCEHCRILTI